MDDRSKSILLQVAFKGAIDVGVPNEEQVLTFYEMLTNLHDKLGIDPSMNDGGRSTTRRRTPSRAPAPEGETFIYEGELYTDFRKAKAAPGSTVKPNYPDFKRESDNQGFWLYDRDGNPNEECAALVAAADGKVF